MIYGHDGTIHHTTALHIEVDDATGEIVAVWFRCMMLPFTVHRVEKDRAESMRQIPPITLPTIMAVHLLDEGPEP